MIDKKSGTIHLGNSFFSPLLTKRNFLSTPYGKNAKLFVNNKEYVSYKIDVHMFMSQNFIPILYFKNESLIEVQLHNYTDSTSWSDLDDIDLLSFKKQNDLILRRNLGLPPFKYNWGEVVSFVDNKSCIVGIIIRY